jgi:hypothetical protein
MPGNSPRGPAAKPNDTPGDTVTLKDESPRQIGNVSVDFGIEKVTKSDEYCSKADRDAKPVKNPKEIKVIFPSVSS